MGFSETTDFVTFKNIGRFNEGVMKTTNFTSPKHGAVTYLTAEELKAVAAHWNVTPQAGLTTLSRRGATGQRGVAGLG